MAVGALVLVGAAVGGLALGLGSGNSGGKTTAAAAPSPAGADVRSPSGGGRNNTSIVRYVALSPGQCFDYPALSRDVTQVTTRSCDIPHDGEVIADETLTGSFTSSAELKRKVLTLCEADAKKRTQSIPADGRTYYYYAIYPSLTTYEAQKKTTISCALTLSNKPGGRKLTNQLR